MQNSKLWGRWATPNFCRTTFGQFLYFFHMKWQWKTTRPLIISQLWFYDAPYYRGISLLRILGKILEKVIASRLDDVTKRLRSIPPHQHGFTSGKGCITELHRVEDELIGHLNNHPAITIVSLDLTKAFDSVWHEGLLYKLHQMDYPLDLVLLLKSYLSGRTFCARVGSTISSRRDLQCGIPQGSILGPKLFVLFKANIPVRQSRIWLPPTRMIQHSSQRQQTDNVRYNWPSRR